MAAIRLLLVALCATIVHADVYLHMPRGSNNRLDDENRDRDNANRVFDSQNNNRGGNNVGQVYYYVGSVAPFEWTNQHSCNNPNNNCEIIIQYMCEARVRDGTTTKTIPDKPTECYNFDCDTDVRFGRHESYDWYQQCKYRKRNKGLFTANQNLDGDAAIYTRQNPNGARRGYECPEERDYYPYWHPTPWRDIAILTNQPTRCEAYLSQSQNTVAKKYCVPPAGWVKSQARQDKKAFIPITQEECEAIKYTDPAATVNATLYGVWTEFPAWGMPAPACRESVWSRDNHLGNTYGGFPAGFNWTVANTPSETCALRLRYNISTNDLGPRHTAQFQSATSVRSSEYINGSLSRRGTQNRDPAMVDMWSKFGLTFADNAVSFDRNNNDNTQALKASREYVLKNNPKVDIFGSLLTGNVGNLKLQLAVNTAQYGRTFQDRTHKFAIRSRTAALAEATIYNLQVKGKRGNIVQTFPGTEYDFHPNRLEMRNGDYVHFQWTGSNTNPHNNAGQGRQGTDRHNVVSLRERVYDERQGVTTPATSGQWGRSYPDRIDKPWPFLGFSQDLIRHLAVLDTPQGQFGGELSELDDAGTYFDLLPQQVTREGIYHYLCTRNNNFSNRGQKGKIVVRDSSAQVEAVGWGGASIQGSGATMVIVPQGSLSGLTMITVENKPRGASASESNVDSDFVNVQPLNLNLLPGHTVTIVIPYSPNAVGKDEMLYSETLDGEYTVLDGATFSDGKATYQASRGGFYVVKTTTNWAAIISITVVILVAIGVTTYFLHKRYKARQAAAATPATSAPLQSA